MRSMGQARAERTQAHTPRGVAPVIPTGPHKRPGAIPPAPLVPFDSVLLLRGISPQPRSPSCARLPPPPPRLFADAVYGVRLRVAGSESEGILSTSITSHANGPPDGAARRTRRWHNTHDGKAGGASASPNPPHPEARTWPSRNRTSALPPSSNIIRRR